LKYLHKSDIFPLSLLIKITIYSAPLLLRFENTASSKNYFIDHAALIGGSSANKTFLKKKDLINGNHCEQMCVRSKVNSGSSALEIFGVKLGCLLQK